MQGLWQPYQPQAAGSLLGASGSAPSVYASAPAPADVGRQAGASLAGARSDSRAAAIMPASIASQAAAPEAAAAPALSTAYSAPSGPVPQVRPS